MPGLDGFQLVREMRSLENPPRVVFVTAYDRYALQAFEVNALDYDEAGVARASRAGHRQGARDDRIAGRTRRQAHGAAVVAAGVPPEQDSVRRRKRLLLDVEQVLYSYVKDGLVLIVTTGARHGGYRTLEEFSSELDPDVFTAYRLPGGVNHIREIIPLASSNYELVMDDPAQTSTVSRQRRELRRIYKW
jgi:DNA-binding LytR/AlgR family response regulator